MKILFVCTGNTCRSPMAEHLFRKMLKDENLTGIDVSSAGISPAYNLELPDEARQALRTENVTDIEHRAQGLSDYIISNADLILTMDGYHLSTLLRRYPDAKGKAYLLNAYASIGDSGIDDPYGQSVLVYKNILSQIKKALIALISKFKTGDDHRV